MVRKHITTIVLTVLLNGTMIWVIGGATAETGIAGLHPQTGSDVGATRNVYGTVDDVTRNLVKVNQEKTEGITPRYLDLSEVEKESPINKGDQVKMKVNLHNIVLDYWIIEDR